MIKKIILLFFIISFNNFSQQKKETKKIKSYKIAFLTESLKLTKKEAEKFWPIYNAYDKKMLALKKFERTVLFKETQKEGGIDNLSEAQAKNLINKLRKSRNVQHETEQVFCKKMETIISYKKQLKLKKAEFEFRKQLIKRLRNLK